MARRSARSEKLVPTIPDLIEQVFREPTKINVAGKKVETTVFGAISLSLQLQVMAGAKKGALNAYLQYQKYARERAATGSAVHIVYVPGLYDRGSPEDKPR